ncbi:hypothetical protein FRC00_010209, partial [Tulasnella sp. 408]
MASTQSSEQSTLVFLRYRDRTVAVVRPKTHKDAAILATRYFRPLEHVPHNRIILSAQLPQYPTQGVVEIHPDSWPAVSNDVDVFEVEEADTIDQSSPAGWQPGSRTLQRIRELGETYEIGPNIYLALRPGPLPSNDTDSCDTAFLTKGIQTDSRDALESPNKFPDPEAEAVHEIAPEPQQLASNEAIRLGV